MIDHAMNLAMNTSIDNRITTPQIYNQSLALLTDLYQLTMSYGYWKNGLIAELRGTHLGSCIQSTPLPGK